MEWKPEPERWKKEYEGAGYLVVENAVDEQTLDALRAGISQIEQGVRSGTLSEWLRRHISLERDRARSYRSSGSDGDAISNIMELPLFGPQFRDFIVYPRILDILEALFGTTEFSFHNYKCICKMPQNGAAFQWHRDLPYLEHTSPDLITCMVCLDEMTEANGATVVCPGTHRIPHEDVRPSDTDIDEREVPEPRLPVLCPAGSAVLFHVSLVHGGGPNTTLHPRRNVIGIWAGPGAYPTTGARYAYEFVMPRSQDPMRRKQIAMTFGHGGTGG